MLSFFVKKYKTTNKEYKIHWSEASKVFQMKLLRGAHLVTSIFVSTFPTRENLDPASEVEPPFITVHLSADDNTCRGFYNIVYKVKRVQCHKSQPLDCHRIYIH